MLQLKEHKTRKVVAKILAQAIHPDRQEITVTELSQWLDDGLDLQLIDVREPNEYAIARIPHTRLIPLAEIVERRGEIDSSRPTIVLCKGGVRSAKAISELKNAGHRGQLINLKGGIIAWSDEVDPEVLKY